MESSTDRGFSLVEVLLSIAVLMVLVVGGLAASSLTATTVTLNQRRSRANILAAEGMEALQSVRAGSFALLGLGVYHPVFDGVSGWSLTSGSEQIGDFTRTLTISSVERGIVCLASVCDIVTAGGVTDENSYWGEVKVVWKELGQDKEAVLTTLLTNWR